MIRVIESYQREQHAEIIDEMYRIRAAVFSERLKWDVKVVNGRETDRFDDQGSVYLISIDENTGRVQGSLRLLPTTGPNMLRNVFQVLLEPDEIIESPLIWESSRFSLNPDIPRSTKDGLPNPLLNRVTVELLCGIVEVCQYAGIQFVVSVYDARMARIFKAADCDVDVIGGPVRIGKVMTYAGMFEINDEMRSRLRRASGLPPSVIEPSLSSQPWAA